MELSTVYTPHLERTVLLRQGTADRQVWADTFTGLYHVPPWMPDPETVLDCGANIGLVSAHYQTIWPAAEIVAVEMDRANARLARRNFGGRVLVGAVSATPGLLRYERSGLRSDAYRLRPDGERATLARTLEQVVRDAFGGRACDLVKLDVEGAERGILERASSWAPLVRRLLVEVHGDDIDRRLGAVYLRAAGYGVVRWERHPSALWAVRD